MKREYSKENLAAIEVRLQEYEDALASDGFVELGRCKICRTVPHISEWGPDCRKCALGSQHKADPDREGAWCESRSRLFSWTAINGAMCETKEEQRLHYKHLLRRLSANGYQFDYEEEK